MNSMNFRLKTLIGRLIIAAHLIIGRDRMSLVRPDCYVTHNGKKRGHRGILFFSYYCDLIRLQNLWLRTMIC